MTLDKMIKEIDLCVDTWYDGFSNEDLKRLSKWLKELKKLRKEVKHCKRAMNVLRRAKHGVLT